MMIIVWVWYYLYFVIMLKNECSLYTFSNMSGVILLIWKNYKWWIFQSAEKVNE